MFFFLIGRLMSRHGICASAKKLCVSPMTFLLTFRSDRYGSLDYLFLIDLIFWKTVIIMVHI